MHLLAKQRVLYWKRSWEKVIDTTRLDDIVHRKSGKKIRPHITVKICERVLWVKKCYKAMVKHTSTLTFRLLPSIRRVYLDTQCFCLHGLWQKDVIWFCWYAKFVGLELSSAQKPCGFFTVVLSFKCGIYCLWVGFINVSLVFYPRAHIFLITLKASRAASIYSQYNEYAVTWVHECWLTVERTSVLVFTLILHHHIHIWKSWK